MTHDFPTPHNEVNILVLELLENIREILGPQFVGMYLEGSLANGGFDADSDIDFVVVTVDPVDAARFIRLQAMHDRLAQADSPWAVQVEGSYIARPAIRRHDPAQADHPNLERGPGERLKIAQHGPDWDIHRYNLRKRGITVSGPAPEDLIDPVPPQALRRAAENALEGWAAGLLDQSDLLRQRGYQSYVVLSLCRILYTLANSDIASKRTAADWMLEDSRHPFHELIRRAWHSRSHPDGDADPVDLDETLAMIRYALERHRAAPRNL